jgi:urease accessory protein
MFSSATTRAALTSTLLAAAVLPAHAHVGGLASSFSTGLGHPLSGLDHMTVMVAVGLWAVSKGCRAVLVWPAAFVGVMLIGGGLGMLGLPLPFVEPAILASVVALGLLVALAVDVPVSAGAVVIGLFALFHGHAHSTEVPASAGAFGYAAGFVLSTALLHATGIIAAFGFGQKFRGLVRAGGAACVTIGAGLALGMI